MGLGIYEMEYPPGEGLWRLWVVENPEPDDPIPPGWRLARLNDPAQTKFICEQGQTGVIERANDYIYSLYREEP
ncbi:hypothetical protein [Streptomyces noursei]|uniref:hypothetical protein n=1 Tax=Streptomyces noursei TaxID=1971 RepID=UPI00167B7FEE|nr:hypothetical protein [Streptomyces noursei]MCZ1015625.1 hypothetical protein [Streptomyces noursei]